MKLARQLHLRATSLTLLVLCLVAALCQPARAQTGGPKKLPSGEKIVDNYLKAIGGKKQVSSIRDATYEWTIQLQDQPMGLAKMQFKAPAAQRSEMTFGNGQIISAANPRSAWVRGIDGQLRTMTGAEAANTKLQAALDAAHFFDYKKANILARVVSVDISPTGPAYVVEFSSRGGARLRYLFSVSSRLLLAIHDEVRKTSVQFEDYRAEGNILEAHTLRMSQGGTGELIFKLQRVTYNAGIDSNLFDPPRAAESVDVVTLLHQVSANQNELEQRFTEYSFIEKRTEREIDSQGLIKKETVKVYEVFPVLNRRPIMKLVGENGVTLPADRAAREDKRVQEEFLKAEHDKDKDAQKAKDQRAQRDRKKAQQSEDDDVEISQFFRHCEFISPRRERFQDREAIVFDFRALPGFKPSTRIESLISKLVGVVWIDPLDKQVIRLEARLAEGFKMGGGLLISLRPGAALVWEQTRLKEGIWMPRFAQINLSVKVLLVGGGDINQMTEWSDYKHFASEVDSYKLGAPKPEESPIKKP